jgi:hypothetical protein
MEAWLNRDGCDGFNVMFPYLPEGLDDTIWGLRRPADRLFPVQARAAE